MNEFYIPSCGTGQIHVCRWEPEEPPKAIVQILHGIAEYGARYDTFARYLNEQGYLVIADDHMGHGQSIGQNGIRGYFHGGWYSAVDDSYRLMQQTMKEFPDLPYILFGHSMGSFMARTILYRYPDSGIRAAVICGTGWQYPGVLQAGKLTAAAACRFEGEKNADPRMSKLMFGTYNKRVEHPRTAFDWLTRNEKIVDRYVEDPLCGFDPTNGLCRDMLFGIEQIQKKENLAKMNKALPVLFVAGGDDPVGAYGEGVRRTADAFTRAGITDVTVKLYPMDRHEILNELNRDEVFSNIVDWMDKKI